MCLSAAFEINPLVTAFPLHIEEERAQPTRGPSETHIYAHFLLPLFNRLSLHSPENCRWDQPRSVSPDSLEAAVSSIHSAGTTDVVG